MGSGGIICLVEQILKQEGAGTWKKMKMNSCQTALLPSLLVAFGSECDARRHGNRHSSDLSSGLNQTTKVENWIQICRRRFRMQFLISFLEWLRWMEDPQTLGRSNYSVFHIICQTEKALLALNDYGHINPQQDRLLILSPACQTDFESSISETVYSFSISDFNQSVDWLARPRSTSGPSLRAFTGMMKSS